MAGDLVVDRLLNIIEMYRKRVDSYLFGSIRDFNCKFSFNIFVPYRAVVIVYGERKVYE